MEYERTISQLEKKIKKLEHEKEEAERIANNLEEASYSLIKELSEHINGQNLELPLEPIEVAKILINATYEYETSDIQRKLLNMPDTSVCERYNIDELEQIAEYLLVHCKHKRALEEWTWIAT